MLGPSFSETIAPPPEPFFARHPLVQAILDVGAVIFAALFVSVTGVGLGAAIVILFMAL